MLEVFHHPGFVSLATLIALEEAGANYRVTLIDFAGGGNRERSFLEVNPCGQVPAIRLADGVVITETVAIMSYIAHRYGAARLAPADPVRYALWIAAMARMASTYHPTFTCVVRPDLIVGGEVAQANARTLARERFSGHLAELDARVGSSLWMTGQDYTLADAHALVFYQWGARTDFPMADYRSLHQWRERMFQREAVQRVMEAEARCSL